jgi:hypothetical protein
MLLTKEPRRTDHVFPKSSLDKEITSHRTETVEIFILKRGRWFWCEIQLKVTTERDVVLGVSGSEIPNDLFL